MSAATCHPDRPVKARGLCNSCYSMAHKKGTVGQYAKLPVAEPKRCVDCGVVLASGATRCSACHRVNIAPRWFCECGPSVVDGLGECARCGRITLEAVEVSLGLRLPV